MSVAFQISKLDAILNTQVKNMTRGINSVSVGFLEGSTYPDGTSVPMVAAVNEFGGSITIPEHSITIFRKVLKSGAFAKNGKFVKASKSNFSSVHTVPTYTVKIPSRPFFRIMIANVKPDLGPLIAHLTKDNDYDLQKVLQIVGAFMKGKLEDSIRESFPTGNAPSTISKKGFDHPLIDKGVMLNSVGVELGTE